VTDLGEVVGLPSIDPGEVVIVVKGDETAKVDEFKTAWATLLPSSTKWDMQTGKV